MRKILIYLLFSVCIFGQYYVEIKATENTGEIFLNGVKYGDISNNKIVTIDERENNEIEIKTTHSDGSISYGKVLIPKNSTKNSIITIKQTLQLTELYYYKKARNLEGYDLYLQKFPLGEYVKTINKLRENYFYNNGTTLEGMNLYLKSYPQGIYYDEINTRKENYLYTNVNNIKTAEEFLVEFPKSIKAKEVSRKLEELYFDNIIDLATVNAFIMKYPESSFLSKALELKELYVYKSVKDIKSALFYKQQYPKGRYNYEVDKKMEEIYFSDADDLYGINEYILKYPTGAYLEIVKQRKSIINFDDYLKNRDFKKSEEELEKLKDLNLDKKELKHLKNKLKETRDYVEKLKKEKVKPNGPFLSLGFAAENDPYHEKLEGDISSEIPLGTNIELGYRIAGLKFALAYGLNYYDVNNYYNNMNRTIEKESQTTKLSLDLLSVFSTRPLYIGIAKSKNNKVVKNKYNNILSEDKERYDVYSLEFPIFTNLLFEVNYTPKLENNDYKIIIKYEINKNIWRK